MPIWGNKRDDDYRRIQGVKGSRIQGKCSATTSLLTNTNAISNLSLRGTERRSNPLKNEIAAPFGLAMTPCDIKIFNAFVLIGRRTKTFIKRRRTWEEESF